VTLDTGSAAGLVAPPRRETETTMAKRDMTRKVRILRTTVASGKAVEAGKTYALSERDAEILIRMGKAVPAGGTAKGGEERDSELAEHTSKRGRDKDERER